jgi:large repetitive protein
MSWSKKLARQIRNGTANRRPQNRKRLELERLEDRLAPAAVPVISLSAPPSPFIGTTAVPVSISLANPSASGATNPGFAPWDYAILPKVGADGDNNEGLSFDNSVTPNYLGAPVTFQVLTVPASGMVTGPSFALGTNGNPIVLNGLTPNDQVVFFQLPFGSYAVDQPGGTINFAVNVSNEATVGAALTLTGGGGFAFGNDALNNPATDPPIVASTTTAMITPTLLHVTKTYLGPEQETATGPNFKEQYEIDISVANAQTINNLKVTDLLPTTMQFVSLNTATANLGAETSDNAATLTATPGGTLTVQFNKVVGTGGASDAKVVFTFYIPELDSTGAQVLPLSSGSFTTSTDKASASGTWTNAFDPTDGNNVSISQSAAPNTITDKSIAVQKSVSVVGGGPVMQGSVLQYTINFQVSDYFAFNQLNIGDLLPDGVRFDQAFTPTLSITQHTDITDHTGNSATANFSATNYLAPPPTTFNVADGMQTLNFAVSNELISRGQSGDLIGGNIPPGGTGGPNPPDALNAPLFGGTTGTIVFRAIVQQQYSVKTSPLGNKDIKQGDSLTNVVPNATGPDVSIQPGGQVLNFRNLAPTGTFQADNSGATVVIATGLLSKSIYAINGNTSVTSPYQMQAGDTVTYRLEYLLPTSTAENFALTDYLPLPVFNATTVTTFDGTNATNTTAPATGVAEFGPGIAGSQPAGFTVPPGTVNYTTIFPNPANDPTLSSNAGTNTVAFTFPKDLEDTQQRESLVDVLFTVTVLDKPFGDGLFLTNQANAQEGNTVANLTTANAIQQIELTQPNLSISKGVVSTNDTGGAFTPGTVGSVPFAGPGSSGAAFTGTITSPGLTAKPINSNVSNLRAGDLVKFAIVVQNTGMSANGAFNVEIKDTLPAGFLIPTNPTALNLQVVDGTGAALAFTQVNAGDTEPLFQSGIELIDPSATQGALAAGKDANGNVVATGKNLAVITYDLQIEPNNAKPDAVSPGQKLTNTASLFNYAAMPGGVDYLTSPLTDPATATIAQPQNMKALVTTSEPTTTGSNVVVGEVVRYQLVVQLPASKSPGFQIVDQLPVGLSYLGNAMVGFVSANGSELFSSTLTSAPYYITGTSPVSPNATATVSGSSTGADGAPVTFALGDVTNNDDANANPEYVVLDFNALVDNIIAFANGPNTAGYVDNNHFITEINNGATQIGPQSNDIGVTIVEPHISTVKTVAPTSAEISDPVTYTITYTSDGGNDAFLPVLTDTIPASITVRNISATSTGGVVNLVNHNTTGNVVDVTADDMPMGSTITVTVMGTVAAATVGVPIVNTADATWSSLPGGVGTPAGGSNTTGQVTPGSDGAATGARDGNTGAGGGSANTYNSSGPASLNIIQPAPVKSLITTSEGSTSGNNVAIGEIVRYELAVQMPKAISPSFQITDALPVGLSFLGNTLVAFVSPTGTYLTSSDPAINNLAGLHFTGTSPNVTPTAVFPTDAAHLSGGTGDGIAVTFSFGNVNNSDTTGADNDFVVLQFNALVDNVAHNQTGTTDSNTFTDLVNNGVGPTPVGPTSNAVNVVIVQPSITNPTKTVTSTGRDPGDTVSYKVTYTNTGNADAFDAGIIDNLPATLTLNTGSIVVKRNGATLATGFTNSTSGNMVNVTLAQVAGTEKTGTGDTIEIDYSATMKITDPAASSISNTANLTYTSLPGPSGTTSNATGQSTPGASGAANGERNGSGGVNSFFGNSSQTITINSSTLTGFVYQDLNNNGVKDPGEPGIPNTTVTLTGTDFLGDPVDVVTTTNGSGQYTFAGLLPSNSSGYTITETQPANFLNGKETPPLNNFSGTIGAGSRVGSTVQFSDIYSGIVIGHESKLTGSNYNFGEETLTNTVPGPQVDPEDTSSMSCNPIYVQLAVNDPNPADPMQVTLSLPPGTGTITLTSTAGLTFTAGSNGTALMTFRGSVSAVNAALKHLVLMTGLYFIGPTTLTITSQELKSSGNPVPGVTATNTVPFTITPVSHPPLVQAPATQAATENVPLVFSPGHGNAITLSDPDVNPAGPVEQLTLTAVRGTVTLATTAGLTFVSGNGTASVTIRGTLNALNAAVNGLIFTPTHNYVGTADLVVTLNDLGNPVGPAMQQGRAITISVA